ncbi:hypothetical protein [Chitinilyticum piscinae]|uniref:Matrixin family metalloprotease n=1 Tax=Chitinilyticum piscinae TaxID=2866724 RepID=A0A8J7FK09_9NEIS|nr:hypothetical protein [Chitinilyticum piscinae]MBE9609012.1 hypothetical protein [Chitinilyticum piscinae]
MKIMAFIAMLAWVCGLAAPVMALDERDDPVWQNKTYVLLYNPSGAPATIRDSDILDAMIAASEAWAPCGVKIEFAGYTKLGLEHDGKNVIGWVPALPGALAHTETRQFRRILTDADIALSASGIRSREWLMAALVHEVGHGIGLVQHSPSRDSILFDDSVSVGTVRPSADDLARCRARYRFR